MEIKRAEMMARDLIGHYLSGYTFKFDKAARRFGLCNQPKRTISLSQSLVALNDEIHVLDTILHEIAHALSPINSHHDEIWKAKAVSIGCNGERCYGKETTVPEGRYMAHCEDCDFIFSRQFHRKRNLTHKYCGGKLIYFRIK